MSGKTGKKTAIATDKAPAAIGPYSQAVRVGDLVFCSGQIPLDPATGALVEGEFAAQARRALDNLTAVLGGAGLSMDDVVRTTIYLADLADFAEANRVYAEYFTAPYPARSTVQAAALPKGARVEIDVIAWAGGGVRPPS
jgi:2-iminobutanoate/2-iminopropanoate deaminase